MLADVSPAASGLVILRRLRSGQKYRERGSHSPGCSGYLHSTQLSLPDSQQEWISVTGGRSAPGATCYSTVLLASNCSRMIVACEPISSLSQCAKTRGRLKQSLSMAWHRIMMMPLLSMRL